MFVPAMAQFSPELAMEALSFPLCNVNSETSNALSSSNGLAPDSCYCGVFALDPFTNWDELAPKILNAEFRGICNFPSLPDFDEEENRALAASGYSYEIEVAKMKELSRYGFELLITYKSADQLAQAKSLLGNESAIYCNACFIR